MSQELQTYGQKLNSQDISIENASYIENNIETKITDDNLFMIDVCLSLKTNQERFVSGKN